MEWHRWLQDNGISATREEAAQMLIEIFYQIYDGILTPRKLLLNRFESARFCERVRRKRGPNSLIR